MRYLLLGCGRSRERRLDAACCLGMSLTARTDFSDGELLTVDANPSVKPDRLIDLDSTRWDLELTAGGFDEIHAYEVLEHLGRQGYAESFFASFRSIWRLLKPDGYLCASVPSLLNLPWLLGDPGHRRVISWEGMGFLERPHSLAPPSSDYRALLDFDFARAWHFDDGANLYFILRAVKPPRPFAES